MKENLLSIADYIESLEQRIAALESANIALQDSINDLQDRLDTLESQPEPEVIEEPEPEPEPEPEIIEEPEIPAEPEIPEVPETPEIPAQPEPEPEPELQPEPEPEPQPEVISRPEPYQASLFGTQVTDIRQAISLGDRFLFQRELFAGNGEIMQRTLDELNKCTDLNAAVAYINRFGWETESTTYKLFINVLRRRFN